MNLWNKRDDFLVHEEEPFNAEPPSDALAVDILTPTDAFYGRNHGPIPDLDADTWLLEINGLVETRMSLSLPELRESFPRHELTATMQCAGNRRSGLADVRDIPGEHRWEGGAIGTATWAGARLADVLAAAGIRDGATDVAFGAPDVSDDADPPQSYGSSISLEKALSPETLIAWEMNGSALHRVHGAPARVVVPGYIGARSVKWIQSITVQDRPSDNYFQATAYRVLAPEADPDQAGPGDGISLGPTALNCEILQPAASERPAAGAVRVTGYAVASERRDVARVEVSVDEQTWFEADLEPAISPWAWRRWSAHLDIPPGATTITARAWDDSGAQQPSDPATLWNPKGYANTSWARRTIEAVGQP